MTFATYHGVTGSATNTPGTSHSVAMPATVNAGDILLASLEFNADCTVSCPGAEFVRLSQRASSPGQWELWGRVASGSEDGTNITFTTDTSQAGAFQVGRWSGTRGGLVAGTDYSLGTATGTQFDGTGNTSPNPPAATAAWGVEDNTFVTFVGYRGDNVVMSAYPANYTNGAYHVSTNGGGGGAGVALATRNLASATDDPGAFTLASAEAYSTQTIVLRPAASSGTNANAGVASAAYSAHDATVQTTPSGSAPAGAATASFSAHDATVTVAGPPPPPEPLSFPDATLNVKLEAAWGADLANPLSWEWTDLTDRLLRSSITLRRGQADEATDLSPDSLAVVLDNGDGELMPGRATSSFYPYVRRGTPLRLQVEGAEAALYIPGGSSYSYASTPDHASFDVTDLDVRIRVLPDQWSTGYNGIFDPLDYIWQDLVGRIAIEVGWVFNIVGPGWPHTNWSTTGAGTTNEALTNQLIASLRPLWIAQTIDANDGAGNHVVSWWRWDAEGTPPTDINDWTLIAAATITGTTTLAAVNAPLQVGGLLLTPTFRGRIYALEYRSGINGTIVANPVFSDQTPGTTGFTDSTGKLWSLYGDAEITTMATRFTGSIDEIVPFWPYGDNNANSTVVPSESRVSIVASDFVRRLGQGAKPLRSPLYRAITSRVVAPHVQGYFPAEEESGAVQFAAGLATHSYALTENIDMGSEDTLPGSAPLPTVAGGEVASWWSSIPGSTTTWAVDFVFKIPTLETATLTQLLNVFSDGDVHQWRLLVDVDTFTIVGSTHLGIEVLNSSAAISDISNRWMLCRLLVTDTATGVDWEWLLTDLSTGTGGGLSGSITDATPGRVTGLSNILTAPPDGISFGHFVVTDGTLEASWLAGADTGWAGESAAHRFWRLCVEEGIPVEVVGDASVLSEFRGDLALSEPMGPQQLEDILTLLAACQAVDMGIATTRRQVPGFLYRCRTTLESQPVPFLELDATNEEISIPLEPRLDDQILRNDIIVHSIAGSAARYVDEVSKDTEGPYEAEVTINGVGGVSIQATVLGAQPGLGAAVLNQNALQAAWRVHLGTWPGLRYPTIVIDLAKAPHLIPAWLKTELGDRITLSGLPIQHPTGVVELLIDAFEEVMSPTSWEVALTCRAGGAWQVGVLDD